MNDAERIADILLDAFALGDTRASRKWGVSTRSIRRYRASLKSDATLAAIVQQKKKEDELDLSVMRIRFLRKALSAMEEKLPEASVHDIAGAFKLVGDQHALLMGIDHEPDEAEGTPPAGASRDTSDGEAEEAARH